MFGNHFDKKEWNDVVERMQAPAGKCPACDEIIKGRRGIRRQMVIGHAASSIQRLHGVSLLKKSSRIVVTFTVKQMI